MIVGAAYYEPRTLDTKEPRIWDYFKFIVFPKDATRHKTRLFKLEMSNLLEPYYVLSEVYDRDSARPSPMARRSRRSSPPHRAS